MDAEDAPPPPSLLDRLRARPARAGTPNDRRVGLAMALLLAAGPLLTWTAARTAADQLRGETQVLQTRAAPRLTAGEQQRSARVTLAPLLTRPGLTGTLEALARGLPAEARLVRAEARPDGSLRVEAVAPDPDRLRAALRRDPLTAELRDVGQRAGEGGMVVLLESRR